MLNTILQYRELIEKSFSISQGLLLSTALEQVVTEKESLLTDLQEEKGIKVPLVGDFSAGKSSLVNTLLNRNGLLPERPLRTKYIMHPKKSSNCIVKVKKLKNALFIKLNLWQSVPEI